MALLRECVVFPTTRCIRAAVDQATEGMLPHYMTMGEFLGRIFIAEGKVVPDDDLRLLGLHEASDFSAFSALEIDRNFFTFLQNAQYIFRFFEELSFEQVEIGVLKAVDVYGEYEEHLSILSRLRERYRGVCERHGWSDPIFASETAEINTQFLHDYDTVDIAVEGYLSRREIDAILRASDVVDLNISYTATPFNQKMTDRLAELGFSLTQGETYRLSISQRRVVESHPTPMWSVPTCELFHNRLAQVGFIKAQIERFADAGIAPEKMAVILPDESFAPLLMEFDDEHNFNFAMGIGFATTPFVREIENILLYLDEANVLNRARIEGIATAKIDWIRSHASGGFCFETLRGLIALYGEEELPAEHRVILAEETERFAHLAQALATMDFRSALRIFMNRLKQRRIDDTRGGKITVMGVLETRGVDYEGVVVVDFNEGFVPHKNEKDLFLNSQTRKFAALPTSYDREALQKHYYARLFARADRVAIGAVQNGESVPSRFLMQMGIATHEAAFRYERVLFAPLQERGRKVQSIEGEYDFKAHPLSASSLKSFLTCRRQFYYRYLLHLAPHEIPRDLSQERDIGNALHAALEALYRERSEYPSVQVLKEALRDRWEAQEGDDALARYMKRLWLEKLEPFYRCETERFAAGWRVLHREKEGEAEIEGIRLVGRIDRIDGREGIIEVIDYKSGKYPDVDKEPTDEDTDYQLSVYAHLAEPFGRVAHCSYYDLGKGELRRERYLEAKNDRLRAILRQMGSQTVWEWEMCEDLSRCRYCPYVYLCGREGTRGV